MSRVSRQSCLSAYDKDANEAKLGAVHRSPGIYHAVENNSGSWDFRSGHSFYMLTPIILILINRVISRPCGRED